MSTPNDQSNPAAATPAYLVDGPGGSAYVAGSPPPFTPTGVVNLTAGTATSNVALGSASPTTLIQNTGAKDAYVKLGVGNTVTAALTDTLVQAGSYYVMATGVNTYLAAITATGSSALKITTGTGIPVLSGGSGGGGGGGAVTVADGADAAEGTTTDAAVTDPTAAATLVALGKGELTLAGSKTETAPASDTASSGLNGRLQRIAQRLTSLIALLPTSLGAKTGAGSLSVVAASDGFSVASAKSATSALTSVSASASSGTILASNASRLGGTVMNDTGGAILYLKLNSGAASLTSYTVALVAGAYYEIPFGYTGAITGIWASASGAARVTEFTA